MDKIKTTLSIALIFVITLTVPVIIYYNTDNSDLKNQIRDLKEELIVLKTANLTTALGVVEVPPQPHQILGSKDSHLWITGWVFNSGGNMARNAGLNVLAFDENSTILLNVTVPVVSGRTFSTAANDSLVPAVPYWLPDSIPLSELKYGKVLSQENATVAFSIFHENVFPSSTIYEIIPVWENNGP